MKKYQAIIQFRVEEDFNELIAPHRVYINYLINKETIDQYVVSMEMQTVWITLNAETRKDAEKVLKQAPLAKYWTYRLTELGVWDGQLYRFPAVQPN